MCMRIMEASRTHDHKVKITVVLATVGLAQAHPNKQLAQFELKKKQLHLWILLLWPYRNSFTV